VKSSKTNNSILILATLGVYFGLVLVGATPVLGHAATTRHFEITDEIEYKDDLDRKPDDEKRSPLDISIGNYYADVEYFLESLERLSRSGKFDVAADTFELSQSTALPCVADNKVGSYTAETLHTSNKAVQPLLEGTTKRITDGFGFADCIPSDRFAGQEATHSHFVLKLDPSGLSLEVSGVRKSPADTAAYLRELAAAWDRFKARSADPVKKHISDATRLSASGSKILVVTRLPRAGLISLLTKRA
jgi:hypothetical protein